MSNFYFVAGASGSGKTAIIPDLKNKLSSFITIYEFDDLGVPANADKRWRQECSEKWLQKLLNDGKNSCLIGQIVLGEILACPSAKQINQVNFCFLDASDSERLKRLKQRNTYGADQNMLNWSSWLRIHHQDPQWMQSILKENCWDGLNFSNWDQLEYWADNINFKFVETTGLEISQVAETVANWIIKKVETPILLNLHNGLYKLEHSTNAAYEHILAESLAFDEQIVPFTQKPKRIELNFIVKQSNDIIGGIYADLYHWNILYICILFVSQAHRKQKLGSILLNRVEEEARSRGCTLSHVETYDFQAKDFYIKQGYEIFGILDNCPPKHKRYFLKKSLVNEKK